MYRLCSYILERESHWNVSPASFLSDFISKVQCGIGSSKCSSTSTITNKWRSRHDKITRKQGGNFASHALCTTRLGPGQHTCLAQLLASSATSRDRIFCVLCARHCFVCRLPDLVLAIGSCPADAGARRPSVPSAHTRESSPGALSGSRVTVCSRIARGDS